MSYGGSRRQRLCQHSFQSFAATAANDATIETLTASPDLV